MSIEKLSTNASLKDVMDKFEELSFQDFSGIDIVILNKLPSRVKNNQIVVITDTCRNITIDTDFPSKPNENDIFIKLIQSTSTYEIFSIKSNNKTIKIKVFNSYKYVNGAWVEVDGYIGINGVWKQLFLRELAIFENKAVNTSITGGFATYASHTDPYDEYHVSSCSVSSTIQFMGRSDGGSIIKPTAFACTKKFIDLSSYSKMTISFSEVSNLNGNGTLKAMLTTSTSSSATNILLGSKTTNNTNNLTFDISNYNSSNMIKVLLEFSGSSYITVKISKILLHN